MEGTNPIEMLNEEVPHLQASFDSAFLIEFGNTGFGITQYMAYAILVFIIVLAVVFGVGRKLTLVPNSKFVNMVEYGYQMVRNNIGEGTIGWDAMARIVRHPALRDLPFILETPNELDGYAEEIRALRELARS